MPLVRQSAARDAKVVFATAAVVSLAWLLIFALWLSRSPQDPASVEETVGPAPSPAAKSAPLAPRPTANSGSLRIPVAGVTRADLMDSFTQGREGGARRHDAIDIAAPVGTPVNAAGEGVVEKLFLSDDGGKTIYIRTPDGERMHYYAHLDRYAPELSEGALMSAGQRLGTVGSTGNADPASPHLHFAVMQMAEGEAWHEGRAINPFPLLTGE